VKGWEEVFHAIGNPEVKVAILISDKIVFKLELLKKDKGGLYKMIKG
jgi:hypothetical protein